MKRNLMISMLIAAALLLTACSAAGNTEAKSSEMEVPHSQVPVSSADVETETGQPDTEEKAPETAEPISNPMSMIWQRQISAR